MDVSRIAKDYTRLQKQSIDNLFDTLSIFQDHAEKMIRFWGHQMGLNDNAQAAVDQSLKVLNQGRDDARKLINEALTNVKIYFAGIGPEQPPE